MLCMPFIIKMEIGTYLLTGFPGVLFDPCGYVLFEAEEDYLQCKYLDIGEHIHVKDGIANIPGYLKMIAFRN